MEEINAQEESAKALALVEKYIDAEEADEDTIYDMLLDNGIDPTVAGGIARDCAISPEDRPAMYGPDSRGNEPAYEADYEAEAEEENEYHALQATRQWLEDVRSRPDIYNFVEPGSCRKAEVFTAEDVNPLTCSGLLNKHGLCEACQDRIRIEEEINRKYAPDSDCPPADFDPSDAGERWSDDY